MPTISGKYKFNSTLPQLAEGEYPVTFTSNGGTFEKFAVEGSNFYYLNASNNGVNAYLFGINFWNSGEAYRDIDFGSTPQTISDTLYNYLVANAAKEETQTTFDLSTLPDISGGTHTIKVKAKADRYIDSEFSNEIEYTKVQAFTLTLNYAKVTDARFTHGRVKIGSAPTSDDDYDYQAVNGHIENKAGSNLGTTVTVENVLKYYTWVAWGTPGSTYWQTPVEHTEQSYDLCYAVCLTGDTLVTMADNSVKRLDMIELGDYVLSFDFDSKMLIPRKVIYTDKNEMKSHTEYDKWTFEDGTEIKTVHRHEFYNLEAQRMKYMDEWSVGEHTYKIDGTTPKLISHKIVEETVRHYKITLEGSTNYFANGLLTGDRNCPKNITLNILCNEKGE